MLVNRCHHTKEDGVICGSPALRRRLYCYFHQEAQTPSGQKAERPEAAAAMRSVKHCRHVMEDGIACHSPALGGESYCHFHLLYKGHRLRTWRGRRILGVRDLHLPPPDDRDAILFSLNEVVQALAAGRLDLDEAGRVLHELNLAGAKLRGGGPGTGSSRREAFPENREDDGAWL